jgi:hypothetical protein
VKPLEVRLIGQMRAMRLNGDTRPLRDLARDVAHQVTGAEAKRYFEARLADGFLRDARQQSLDLAEHTEVEMCLPFVTGDIGRYRTPDLVHVRRNGLEDFLKHDVVFGTEINGHDAWEELQRKRALAHVQTRRKENTAHTEELRAIGYDPSTQTNHDMHKLGDIRVCVLCGEGPIAGDPWERDHETPVAMGEGAGRIGWAHRSCNRSKGREDIAHQTV